MKLGKMKKQMSKEDEKMMKEVQKILSPWSISSKEFHEIQHDPLKSSEWKADIRTKSIKNKLDEINSNLKTIKTTIVAVWIMLLSVLIMLLTCSENIKRTTKFLENIVFEIIDTNTNLTNKTE